MPLADYVCECGKTTELLAVELPAETKCTCGGRAQRQLGRASFKVCRYGVECFDYPNSGYARARECGIPD